MGSSEERHNSKRIHVKPFSDVLDEMDANIRATAEAARRAEEAARAAREAAGAATKALELAAQKEPEKFAGLVVRGAGYSVFFTGLYKALQDAAKAAAEAEAVIKDVKEATRATIGRYLVIFEKAGRNYSAYSPDIPGCIATGKDREEVEKNIKEAIILHFAGLAEDGLSIPEPASFIEYIEV